LVEEPLGNLPGVVRSLEKIKEAHGGDDVDVVEEPDKWRLFCFEK